MESTSFWFLVLTLVHVISAIYEDQIGKFDWRKEFVGSVKFAEFDPISSIKTLIVASEENVLGSILFENGEILWRKVFDSSNRGLIQYMHVGEHVVTVSGTGPYFVQIWHSWDGTLKQEWTLKVNHSSDVGDRSYWSSFQETFLHLVSFDRNNSVIVSSYDTKTGTLIGAKEPIRVQWWSSEQRCELIDQYLICYEPATKIVHLLDTTKETENEFLISDADAGGCSEKLLHRTPKPVPFVLSNKKNKYFSIEVCIGRKIVFLINQLTNEIRQIFDSQAQAIGQLSIEDNGKFLLELHQDESEINVNKVNYDGKKSSVFKVNANKLQSKGGKMTILTTKCSESPHESFSCNIVLKSGDLSLYFLRNPTKIMAVREESLSNVLTASFVDLPVSDHLMSVKSEFDEHERNVFAMFSRRIQSQLNQLKSILEYPVAFSSNWKSAKKLTKDDFGLHKLIILATAAGKLYGVDSTKGEIVWTQFFPNIRPFESNGKKEYFIFVQKSAKHHPYRPQCALLAKNAQTNLGMLILFDALSGRLLNEENTNLPYRIKQAFLLKQTTKDHVNPLVVIDTNNELHAYPTAAKSLFLKIKSQLYFYVSNEARNSISGYTFAYVSESANRATPKWTLNLSENETIVEIAAKNPNENVRSQGRVLPDRSVIYKYINPHLIAVVTQSSAKLLAANPKNTLLNLYLIDSVTGLVVHSITHKRVTKPVNIVHSENWLIYSYYNEKFRRTEITSLEFYESDKGQSSNRTVFSSFNQMPVFVQKQSYILPANIVRMKETITLKGITNKHVLMALSSGSVLSMPWIFLDPRRPLVMPSNPNEDVIIPYKPDLPIQTETFLNYNKSLYRVRSIAVAPSDLESTCLVLVSGLDLFFTRIAPSKEFDILKDDFNFIFMSTLLFALVVASVVLRKMSLEKSLKEVWKCQ